MDSPDKVLLPVGEGAGVVADLDTITCVDRLPVLTGCVVAGVQLATVNASLLNEGVNLLRSFVRRAGDRSRGSVGASVTSHGVIEPTLHEELLRGGVVVENSHILGIQQQISDVFGLWAGGRGPHLEGQGRVCVVGFPGRGSEPVDGIYFEGVVGVFGSKLHRS